MPGWLSGITIFSRHKIRAVVGGLFQPKSPSIKVSRPLGAHELKRFMDLLGVGIQEKESVLKIARKSGIKISHMDTSGSAIDLWGRLLGDANEQGRDVLCRLVLNALLVRPNSKKLHAAKEMLQTLDSVQKK